MKKFKIVLIIFSLLFILVSCGEKEENENLLLAQYKTEKLIEINSFDISLYDETDRLSIEIYKENALLSIDDATTYELVDEIVENFMNYLSGFIKESEKNELVYLRDYYENEVRTYINLNDYPQSIRSQLSSLIESTILQISLSTDEGFMKALINSFKDNANRIISGDS